MTLPSWSAEPSASSQRPAPGSRSTVRPAPASSPSGPAATSQPASRIRPRNSTWRPKRLSANTFCPGVTGVCSSATQVAWSTCTEASYLSITGGQPRSYSARAAVGSSKISHPECSRRASVRPGPAAENQSRTWLACSAVRPGYQSRASSCGGSQVVTVAQIESSAPGRDSTNNPSRNATVEPCP